MYRAPFGRDGAGLGRALIVVLFRRSMSRTADGRYNSEHVASRPLHRQAVSWRGLMGQGMLNDPTSRKPTYEPPRRRNFEKGRSPDIVDQARKGLLTGISGWACVMSSDSPGAGR